MTSKHQREEVPPIGRMLRQCRRTAGLTQSQLAEAAGVSLPALRDLEQGRTATPRWGTVENLARVLGLGRRQRAELLRTWPEATGSWAGLGSGEYSRPHGSRSRPEVRIDVLGSLAASRFGRAVPLGSVRQRAVLGLLVLHHDTWMHRDALIAALWADEPPVSAVAGVLGYVNRLRDLLDPMRPGRDRDGLIASAGHAYRFSTERADLDLAVTVRWARQAESAAHDPARACELYEQALALWRQDPLADVDLLWQHPAVVALAGQRTDLVLRYAATAATAGSPSRALRALRELCAREPLHEQAHASLMLAMAAGGEQAAALGVFTALRRRLDVELGVRPSPVLADAHLRVLR